MQRASSQHDHLAGFPRAGPRQSSGRRSVTARHWRRTVARCATRMEPAVRGARIEPAIVAVLARDREFSSKKLPVSRSYVSLEICSFGRTGWWGTIWIKLHAPHADIEPVSRLDQERNFSEQRQTANSGICPRLKAQRPRSTRNSADMSLILRR